MAIKCVTLDEMKAAVIQVYQDYNGNIPIQFKIRETAEELYGYEAVRQHPELKSAQGAYLPNGDHRGRDRGQSYVYFQSSCILYDDSARGVCEEGYGRNTGIKESLRVVRHEILGHYGLNTCEAEQKLNILEKIIDHRHDTDLQKVWKEVERDYPSVDKIGQAEEVFSFVAENKPAIDISFSLSSEPFTLSHVEQIAARIAEGIRVGERVQKIFPSSNQAQFYKEDRKWLATSLSAIAKRDPISQDQALTFSTEYHWSKAESKMRVTINGQAPDHVPVEILDKIILRDKFLNQYSRASVNSGLLDLRVANGVQPVPKAFNAQGEVVQVQQLTQSTKLKF